MSKQPEKEHAVIVNGHRATGLLSEQEAEVEARNRRSKLHEAEGKPAQESKVQVKRNLCG